MPDFLKRDQKPNLAYHYTPPNGRGLKLPLIVFCGGFQSDMTGTKATYFEEQCQAKGQAYLRFDYSGHGSSEGDIQNGCISDWAGDAQDVIDHVRGDQKVVLVGSSMGGWIALLLALKNSDWVHGVIGIAAAPDFTDDIYHNRLNDDQRVLLHKNGFVEVENDYSDEPYVISERLIEDGKRNMLLESGKNFSMPLRFFQGQEDKDVPWQTTIKIQKQFNCPDLDVILIDDGDHRLSRAEDLELIQKEINALANLSA